MHPRTPEYCRTEAARQQRLANEFERAGDIKKYLHHQQRSIELDREAVKLEQQEGQ
jgi:hypothetical protein